MASYDEFIYCLLVIQLAWYILFSKLTKIYESSKQWTLTQSATIQFHSQRNIPVPGLRMNADETGFYCWVKPVFIYKVSLVIALEDLKIKATLTIITIQKKQSMKSWPFKVLLRRNFHIFFPTVFLKNVKYRCKLREITMNRVGLNSFCLDITLQNRENSSAIASFVNLESAVFYISGLFCDVIQSTTFAWATEIHRVSVDSSSNKVLI